MIQRPLVPGLSGVSSGLGRTQQREFRPHTLQIVTMLVNGRDTSFKLRHEIRFSCLENLNILGFVPVLVRSIHVRNNNRSIGVLLVFGLTSAPRVVLRVGRNVRLPFPVGNAQWFGVG